MAISLDKVKYLGLALGLFGFMALLFLVPEYKPIRASDATEKLLGQKVSFSGTVRDFFIAKGNAFFTLENAGTLSAVMFRPRQEETLWVRKGETIQVQGTLSLYKDGFEIIVDRIRPVS